MQFHNTKTFIHTLVITILAAGCMAPGATDEVGVENKNFSPALVAEFDALVDVHGYFFDVQWETTLDNGKVKKTALTGFANIISDGSLGPDGEVGGRLILTLCEASLPKVAIFSLTMEPSTVALTGPIEIPFWLSQGEDGTTQFNAETGFVQIGSQGDPPVAFDQDNDNKPGVTIRVSWGFLGGKIYMNASSTFSLEGTMFDNDGVTTIVGIPTFDFEYTIIGDNIPGKDIAAEAEAARDQPSKIVSKQVTFQLTEITDSQITDWGGALACGGGVLYPDQASIDGN